MSPETRPGLVLRASALYRRPRPVRVPGAAARGPDPGPGPRQEARQLRRLHGEGPQGLERPRHRRRHRQGDKLVFAKGYGYRDYGKKLPFTPDDPAADRLEHQALHGGRRGPAGRGGQADLGQAGPRVRPGHPLLQRRLDHTVTLRDMLSHRTGITRHDTIWYKSDFTRKQLFERLKYLEPREPLRQTFLYNNMMYAAAGYLIELQSGKTWEEFVPRAHLQAAGHDHDALLHRRHAQAARPRRALHGEARHLRALPDPLLRGHGGVAPAARSSPTSRTCPTG